MAKLLPKDPYAAMMHTHYHWNAKRCRKEAAQEIAAYGGLPTAGDRLMLKTLRNLNGRNTAMFNKQGEFIIGINHSNDRREHLIAEVPIKAVRRALRVALEVHMCRLMAEVDAKMLRNAL